MPSRWPTLLLWAAIVVCLFFGFWGWVYQGYTEDAGVEPTQTWPIGAGGYLLAGALIVVVVRRKQPGMSAGSMLALVAVLAVFFVIASILSIDAGNP